MLVVNALLQDEYEWISRMTPAQSIILMRRRRMYFLFIGTGTPVSIAVYDRCS